MSAIPNLLHMEIEGELNKRDASAESVVAGIASSEYLLKAVRLGMADSAGEHDAHVKLHHVLKRVDKMLSAGTANQMFT